MTHVTRQRPCDNAANPPGFTTAIPTTRSHTEREDQPGSYTPIERRPCQLQAVTPDERFDGTFTTQLTTAAGYLPCGYSATGSVIHQAPAHPPPERRKQASTPSRGHQLEPAVARVRDSLGVRPDTTVRQVADCGPDVTAGNSSTLPGRNWTIWSRRGRFCPNSTREWKMGSGSRRQNGKLKPQP